MWFLHHNYVVYIVYVVYDLHLEAIQCATTAQGWQTRGSDRRPEGHLPLFGTPKVLKVVQLKPGPWPPRIFLGFFEVSGVFFRLLASLRCVPTLGAQRGRMPWRSPCWGPDQSGGWISSTPSVCVGGFDSSTVNIRPQKHPDPSSFRSEGQWPVRNEIQTLHTCKNHADTVCSF